MYYLVGFSIYLIVLTLKIIKKLEFVYGTPKAKPYGLYKKNKFGKMEKQTIPSSMRSNQDIPCCKVIACCAICAICGKTSLVYI